MNFTHHFRRYAFFFLLLALVLAGCGDPSISSLNPSGDVAEKQLRLIILSLLIMLAVMAVVLIIYFYVLVRFRKRPDQTEYPEQVEGNTKLEILWTVIPIILLAILIVPTVYQTFVLADDKPQNKKKALTVTVTAHQFWWEFEYPELGITTASDLYIPTDTRIYLDLKAADVKHSFWVPALAGKQDNNPGLTNTMYLNAPKPGVYKGQCAELCGASHALMDFKVIAVPKEEFDQWVQQMKNASAEPETATARKGRQVFEQNCVSCHAIGAEKNSVGPNLTGFANRHTLAGVLELNKQNLIEWIADPSDFKGGVEMPSFEGKLTKEQIHAVAEYLLTLKLNE